MTGVLAYTGTHRVKTTTSPTGTVVIHEAGQTVEGSAGTAQKQVS